MSHSDGVSIFLFILFVLYLFSDNSKKLNNEDDVNATELTQKLIKDMEAKWSKYFVDHIEPLLHDGNPVDITINHIKHVHKPVNQIETTFIISEVDKIIAASCSPGMGSSIQDIKVPGINTFPVLCDSIFADSGWTVILRRLDGSVNFNRNWIEYRRGFGDLHSEFFIGLEKLHRMTKWHTHELIIYLKDEDNEVRHAQYSEFRIDNAAASYALRVLGAYSGNAGDSLSTHINATFSTPDTNKDCAMAYKSGWWFHKCMDR